MKKSLMLPTILLGAASLMLSADVLATSTVDPNKILQHKVIHPVKSMHPVQQTVHGTEHVFSGVGHAAVGLVGGVVKGTGMVITDVVHGTGKVVTGVFHGTGHVVKGTTTALTKPLHRVHHHPMMQHQKMHHQKMHHQKMHHQKMHHQMKHEAEMTSQQKLKTPEDMKNKTDMTGQPSKS